MPVRKRGVFRFRHELSVPEWLDLTIGTGGKHSAFVDVDERREAWRVHQDRLLERHRAGHRPAAWWDFEHPDEERPFLREQTLRLLEMGEIGADELLVLKRLWRGEERTARAISEQKRAPGTGRLKQEIYMDRRRWAGIPDWYEPDDFREGEADRRLGGEHP